MNNTIKTAKHSNNKAIYSAEDININLPDINIILPEINLNLPDINICMPDYSISKLHNSKNIK